MPRRLRWYESKGRREHFTADPHHITTFESCRFPQAAECAISLENGRQTFTLAAPTGCARASEDGYFIHYEKRILDEHGIGKFGDSRE